jgi:FkbM family methyltransferase
MKFEKRPISFVIAATDHGTMIVNRHDYNVGPGGIKYGVGHDLLQFSSFDLNEVDLVVWLLSQKRLHCGDGVFAIDCGANIGVHTVEWAKSMHGWGSLLAIEAQERIFYALAGNISLNNCSNARALWAAVGSSAGSIMVPQLDYHQPASFGSLEIRERDSNEYIGQSIEFDEKNSIVTPLFAIDDLEIERLDFIKMDIEGMESEALAGAINTIKKCKPYLLIEKIKSDQQELQNFFISIEYEWVDAGIAFLAFPQNDLLKNNLTIKFS